MISGVHTCLCGGMIYNSFFMVCLVVYRCTLLVVNSFVNLKRY